MTASSRIIVKNLPKNVTETKLRDLFGKQGTITDVQLKYTPDGRFRHFAFIGYTSEKEADAARDYFDKTYIGAVKIDVQNCTKLGDPSKPRAWSKYAADSSKGKAAKRKLQSTDKEVEDVEDSTNPKKIKRKRKEEEILEKCKEDPDFLEFLESHRKKSTWGNDTVLDELEKYASTLNKKEKSTSKDSTEVSAAQPVEKSDIKTKTKKKAKSSTEAKSDVSTISSEGKKRRRRAVQSGPVAELFSVKLKGLPKKAKKQNIKDFFSPLIPKSIRLPAKYSGYAYVGFKTEAECNQAMYKDKSFILGEQISVKKVNAADLKNSVDEKLSRWAVQTAELEKECETVGESGRIFIRNLPYTTDEDQIKELFEKYGTVTEVHLPLDRLTRKIKGFGFVSFFLPEHATKAFNELDGTIFQGRMLHLLPSKNKEEDSTSTSGSSFKKSKAMKEKKSAGSSHNWNTLFMGQNAVAQVVSQKYGVSKEELLLDRDETVDRKKMSVGVRMALAEAEVVDETKNFLIQNDVRLEAFDNAKAERSKTIILVKNLPANTEANELLDLFSKHGEIGRVILPPSGVTGIVEFLEPAEARAGFKKLAYTKFKDIPLYLEWAPNDTFKSNPDKLKHSKNIRNESNISNANEKEPPSEGKSEEISITVPPVVPPEVEKEDDEYLDMIPETDTTLFVKNLNFNTEEQRLKDHFKQCGPVYSVTVARKKDSKHPGQLLSMGYGFVQFYRSKDVSKALKELQGSVLQNHKLELKKSNRTLQNPSAPEKQSIEKKRKQGVSKILVRNVPFQATADEIKQLFVTFGEIRACRMPLKMDGSGEHRGFAFVDFVNPAMAEKAFETLEKSTHLYGRRLVLEWAQKEDTVEDLRQKTTKQFQLQASGGKESLKTSTKKGITRYFHSQESSKKNDDEDD